MPTKEQLEQREKDLFGAFKPNEMQNPVTKLSFDEALRNIRALRSRYAGN